jgi:hypothetical protein
MGIGTCIVTADTVVTVSTVVTTYTAGMVAHGTRSRIRSDGAGPVGVVVKMTHRLGIEPDMSKHNYLS